MDQIDDHHANKRLSKSFWILFSFSGDCMMGKIIIKTILKKH